MKVYEVASVFLIIGGVLLGPIERKCTIQNPFGASQCSRSSAGRESVAIACARAIQEIGGVQSGGIWYLKNVPSKIICIPAPSRLFLR